MSTATMVHHSSPQSSSSKDPQSPTLSCTHTTSSSSSDDDPVKPARMGRVIFQEDDPFPDADADAPQERDEQLSSSHSHLTSDNNNNSDKLQLQLQLQLLQSIEVITQLAVMDRGEYQKRLVENSLPVVLQVQVQQKLQVGSSDDHHHSSQQQQQQQQHNNLAKLTQSLHRFHSLVANLERENDSQTLEIYKLQTDLENVKERNQKLETAVQKLHKRNTKLKKEKSQQSIGKKIFDQVSSKSSNKNSNNNKEQHEFLKMASKVQQHEMALRERTDSNFSDLDGLEAFNFNDSLNMDVDLDVGLDNDVKVNMNNELDGEASVSTTTSLITDESAATVKISRERTFTWPRVHCHKDDNKNSNNNDDDDDYDAIAETLGNAVGTTSTKSKSTTTSPFKSSVSLSEHNPFAAFLSPRPAQPYTLSFVAPYTLQLVQLPIETASTATTTATTACQESYAPPPAHAVVCIICGYHGFDANSNVKPTLGARLLKINKQTLDPKWTIPEIEKHIASQGKACSMTFRNDTWDKKQKEMLTAAVAQQEKLHRNNNNKQNKPAGNMLQEAVLRKRSQSGELQKNLLGFLNFNHHGERPITPEKIVTPPRPPRPTTTATTTTPPQQAEVSPIQDMIAFLRTNHIANTTPEEGVTFDDQAAQMAFPTSPEQARQKGAATMVVDLKPKVQAIETDDSLATTPSPEEKKSAASTSTVSTATTATASTDATATATMTAPKSQPKSPDVKAADAFKSSMMNMGKLFAFR